MFTQIDSSVKIYVVAMSQPNYPPIIRRKGTTNIWNTQGFSGKKISIFMFLAKNRCYSHNCATVLSKGPLVG